MKQLILPIILLALGGCASTSKVEEASATQAVEAAETKSEPTTQQKIYYFQHKLLPKWTFESNGQFLDDLLNGRLAQLEQAASEIVSPEYYSKIMVMPLDEKKAVAISFPSPEYPAHCFYALIVNDGQGFSYYTYEKTLNLFGEEDMAGVVGGWGKEGGHHNYGPRAYTDLDSFIKDVLK